MNGLAKWTIALSLILLLTSCSDKTTTSTENVQEDHLLIFQNHHTTTLLQFELILKSLLNDDTSSDYTRGMIDQYDASNHRVIAYTSLNNITDIEEEQKDRLLELYDGMQDFVIDLNPDDVDEQKIKKMISLVEEVRGMDVTKRNENDRVKELTEWLDK